MHPIIVNAIVFCVCYNHLHYSYLRLIITYPFTSVNHELAEQGCRHPFGIPVVPSPYSSKTALLSYIYQLTASGNCPPKPSTSIPLKQTPPILQICCPKSHEFPCLTNQRTAMSHHIHRRTGLSLSQSFHHPCCQT